MIWTLLERYFTPDLQDPTIIPDLSNDPVSAARNADICTRVHKCLGRPVSGRPQQLHRCCVELPQINGPLTCALLVAVCALIVCALLHGEDKISVTGPVTEPSEFLNMNVRFNILSLRY